MMTIGQVIQIEKISTISILLASGITIELQKALAFRCNSNLILLGQLHESGIAYYNNLSIITLMRSGEVITYVRRSHNSFILDLTVFCQIILVISKAIAIISQDRPSHLVNKNKCICF